jgi:hypothetical protein
MPRGWISDLDRVDVAIENERPSVPRALENADHVRAISKPASYRDRLGMRSKYLRVGLPDINVEIVATHQTRHCILSFPLEPGLAWDAHEFLEGFRDFWLQCLNGIGDDVGKV